MEEVKERSCPDCGERLRYGFNTLTTHSPIAICDSCLRSKSMYKRYGITLRTKIDMLKVQNNSCAICPIKFVNEAEAHIDHCHITGRTRGLLCRKCNTGLGALGDSLSNIERALVYLRHHTDKTDDKI